MRTSLDRALFVAILATGLSLGGALAHLYALPNKIAMPLDRYFTAQAIYAGWAQLGHVLGLQLVAIRAVVLLARGESAVRSAALVALVCLIAAQVVFRVWTQPANWRRPTGRFSRRTRTRCAAGAGGERPA